MRTGIYANLREKQATVESVRFDDTFFGLLRTLDELCEEKYVFRGQRNALWPVVSSGWRAYSDYLKRVPTSKLEYMDFLTQSLSYVKFEKDFLPTRPSFSFRKKYYDHEMWGWLQHYSYPTPFIDFTSDPLVALYMATVDSELSPADGYFSVYAMRGDYAVGDNEAVRLEDVIKHNAETLNRAGMSDEQKFAFGNWKDFGFCLVHKDGSLKPWAKEIARERIASQNGLFVFLDNSRNGAFEEYCYEQDKMRPTNGGHDGDGCWLPKLKCLDIHNSLIPLVKEHCRKRGYTSEYLGLADQSIDLCMKCLAKRFQESLVLKLQNQ